MEPKRYCANRGSGYCGECVSSDLSDKIDELSKLVSDRDRRIEALEVALSFVMEGRFDGSEHHDDCPYSPTNSGCSKVCEIIQAALSQTKPDGRGEEGR